MSRSIFHSGFRSGLFVLLAVASLPAGVSAQSGGLPDAVITAVSVSSDQEGEIKRYVASLLPELNETDPDVRQGARDGLLEPLRGDATRDFRVKYSRAVGPTLRGLVKSRDLGVSMCAVQVAGALASQQGYEALKIAMKDPRPAIRYTAFRGMGSLLQVVSKERAALPQRLVDEAIRELGTALGRETDLLIVQRIAGSLVDGIAVNAPIRGKCLKSLCLGLAEQIKTRREDGASGDEQEMRALLRPVLAVRDTLINQRADKKFFAKEAAIMAGHALAYCQLELREAGKMAPESSSLDDLAIVSEAVILFANQALSSRVIQSSIDELFPRAMRSKRLNEVNEAVDRLIGPNGALTRPPYNVGAADFSSGR